MADAVSAMESRAARATATRPEFKGVVLAAMGELARRSSIVSSPAVFVQTHGRYHARHVFVDFGSVTVIDLDRMALFDPAADVGGSSSTSAGGWGG
jgi:hypothetical protein